MTTINWRHVNCFIPYIDGDHATFVYKTSVYHKRLCLEEWYSESKGNEQVEIPEVYELIM